MQSTTTGTIQRLAWRLHKDDMTFISGKCTIKKGEKEEREANEDRKERAIARVQWLCFTRKYNETIQMASELINSGSVAGCLLSRAEKAELNEIKSFCESKIVSSSSSSASLTA